MSNNIEKRKISEKQQIILDSAIKIFTQKGFDASSMDEIAETAGVSKRTIYNHYHSKENLFQQIVGDFLADRDSIKPIEYSKSISLVHQLKAFAKAEIHLIDEPVRRSLSKLITSVFLMKFDFGKSTRTQYSPHKDFIQWLQAAQNDGKLIYQSPQITAHIFYGLVEGCITWNALMSDGESLKKTESILDEIIEVFLSRYGTK